MLVMNSCPSGITNHKSRFKPILEDFCFPFLSGHKKLLHYPFCCPLAATPMSPGHSNRQAHYHSRVESQNRIIFCLRTPRCPYPSHWDYCVSGPGSCETIPILEKGAWELKRWPDLLKVMRKREWSVSFCSGLPGTHYHFTHRPPLSGESYSVLPPPLQPESPDARSPVSDSSLNFPALVQHLAHSRCQ